MPRQRNPERPSRARRPADIAPIFLRRPELARAIGLTEGFIRQQEARGNWPAPIRLGDRVVVYELATVVEWLRRNASHERAA